MSEVEEAIEVFRDNVNLGLTSTVVMGKVLVAEIARLTKELSDEKGRHFKKCGHGPEMLKVVDLYCAQCVEEAKP